jgi:signal transduction histidine kinase
MSLRGLFLSVAGILLALAHMTAGALITITTRMERNSEWLWQAVESVRAAEEIEIALLLHSREHRLLALTGDEHHLAAMQEAEVQLRHWLSEAHDFVGSPQEAAVLQEVSASITEYLMIVSQQMALGPGTLAGNPQLIDQIDQPLGIAERLVEINLSDARRVADETAQWDQMANLLGVIVSGALLGGVVLGLWGIRRYVYRPLLAIRNALVHFHPGTTGVVPEVGPVELREIAREFKEMAERLARHRAVQLGFIAGVAHDLLNPLSALKLGAATVRPDRPLPPEEKVRERFALVVRQAERIEQMVGDLLDTARIEAGELELRPEKQDLRDLIREAIQLHEGLSAEHELALRLPEGPVSVRCDGTRISQVLNNLLSNAIKYSPQGGQVRVELTTASGEAWVAVTDQGVGIPAEEQDSIFEPFRRSVSTRDTIPGVGLGLSVARRIIEAHGGRIQVESKQGEGSTFRFWLPHRPEAND